MNSGKGGPHYVYFCSYFYVKGPRTWHGRCELQISEPITKIEHIGNLEKLIRKDFGNKHLVISNYQLLRVETDCMAVMVIKKEKS